MIDTEERAKLARMADAAAGRWYVMLAKPQRERSAFSALCERGYHAYMAMYRRRIIHHRSKRIIERDFPLFGHYLFAKIPEHANWLKLHDVPFLTGYLGKRGEPLQVAPGVVEAIMKADIEGEFDDSAMELKVARRTYRPGIAARVLLHGNYWPASIKDVTAEALINLEVMLFGRPVPVTVSVAQAAYEVILI